MSKRSKSIAIFLVILYICLPQNAHFMTLYKEQGKNLDVTRGLNDAEIEMALNDLSLTDLNALSELMDTANKIESNYDDDSFPLNNVRDSPLYETNSYKNGLTAIEAVEGVEGVEDVEDAADFDQGENADGSVMYLIQENPDTDETQRSKRDNHHQVQVDEEYIKQLDFSFPRYIEQNHHDDNDIKKDHVRVKRN